MRIVLFDRDGTGFNLPAGLSLSPLSYRVEAQGGPRWADIEATGNADTLWSLLGWLGYQVRIEDNGTPFWWGYIHGVEIPMGAITVGLSLDSMSNRVAVRWSGPAGYGITSYAEDTESSGVYGQKEIQISADGVDSVGAEQRRDWELDKRKLPIQKILPSLTTAATIVCRGEIDRLGWTYLNRDEGLIEHVPGGGEFQKLGWGGTLDLSISDRTNLISDIDGLITSLGKGDKFKLSSTTSNNATFTVEEGSQREAKSVTASTIAFLQQERNASQEYLRASQPDVTRMLNNPNVKSGTVIVTDDGASTTYTETTDYIIDYTNGAIAFVSTGSITNNQVVKVSYTYTENRIEDSNLGLQHINARDAIRITGAANAGNNDYFEVISSDSEGARVVVRQSLTNEGPGNSVTIERGSALLVEEDVTDETDASSATATLVGVILAQSFTVPSDANWTVATVQVRAAKIGTPVDNLQCAIYSDSSGLPGSPLEAVTVVGDSLTPDMDWVTFEFANTTTLSVGTTYWIRLARTGSNSVEDFYEIDLDEDQTYGGGVLKLWDGASWVDRTLGGDLIFRVIGEEETTTQISTMIGESAQFLTGSDVQDTSGVDTPQYRDGRASVLTELLDLLEIGTTNDVRLLATVTPDRELKVIEEPSEPDIADYRMRTDGQITNQLGQPLRAGDLSFVGQWVELVGFPQLVAGGVFAGPSPFLVEAAVYDVGQNAYSIEPAGSDPEWRAGMSIDEG